MAVGQGRPAVSDQALELEGEVAFQWIHRPGNSGGNGSGKHLAGTAAVLQPHKARGFRCARARMRVRDTMEALRTLDKCVNSAWGVSGSLR